MSEFKVGDFIAFDRAYLESLFENSNGGWKRMNETDFLVRSDRNSDIFDVFEFGKAYKIIDVNDGFICIDGDSSNEQWSPEPFRYANGVEVARWKIENET